MSPLIIIVEEENSENDPIFVPIFEKDGNRFFILSPDFKASDEYEAMWIGWGSMLVECILLGMEFKGEVIEIDPHNTPHRTGKIIVNGNHDSPIEIAIISGKAFDEVHQEKTS